MNIKILPPAVAVLILSAGAASADTITFDTSLASPGVYYGSGNSNSGFTVDQSGPVELGLEAITRYIGPVTPTGSVYDVPTGTTTVAGKNGADWGFVFSINLHAVNGFPYTNLSQVTPTLTMTDVGKGTTGSFNLEAIPDNAMYGPFGGCGGSGLPSCFGPASYYALQNSEALSFTSIAAALGDPGYNVNANDTYDFKLNVDQGNTVLASDSISVVAGSGATPVPEPLTISLFGTGLIGLFILRRKKKLATA